MSFARVELLAFFFAGGASRAASESAVARYAALRELLGLLVPGALGGVPPLRDGAPASMPLGPLDVDASLGEPHACMRCGAVRAPRWRELCDGCELFVALVLREHSLRSAAGFATASVSECVLCAAPLPLGHALACSVHCGAARDSLLEGVHHALSCVRGSAEPALPGASLLLGPAPPGLAHVRAVRTEALAALRRDAADLRAPESLGSRVASAPTFDDSRQRPGSNGVAPGGADAPGVSALRDAVAALATAGVAADARREATAARCSALVEGAAAAVADCARAFADAGCTVEAERYRGVARRGFDVAGFHARFAAARVEVRVSPLGGVYTVHGACGRAVQRFALYRGELRDGADCDTWVWHVEVAPTDGSACVVLHRGLSRRVLWPIAGRSDRVWVDDTIFRMYRAPLRLIHGS